jgi:hypothetical protein
LLTCLITNNALLGLLITLAREKGFCDSDEWNERYDRCMACANTYGIWKYYGEGVKKAAEQCDLSPSPSPSGAGAVSTAFKTPTSTAEEPEDTAVDTSTNAPEVSETATTEVITSKAASVEATSATQDAPKQTEVVCYHGCSYNNENSNNAQTTPTPTPSTVAANSASRQYSFPTFIGLVAWTIISLC